MGAFWPQILHFGQKFYDTVKISGQIFDSPNFGRAGNLAFPTTTPLVTVIYSMHMCAVKCGKTAVKQSILRKPVEHNKKFSALCSATFCSVINSLCQV